MEISFIRSALLTALITPELTRESTCRGRGEDVWVGGWVGGGGGRAARKGAFGLDMWQEGNSVARGPGTPRVTGHQAALLRRARVRQLARGVRSAHSNPPCPAL